MFNGLKRSVQSLSLLSAMALAGCGGDSSSISASSQADGSSGLSTAEAGLFRVEAGGPLRVQGAGELVLDAQVVIPPDSSLKRIEWIQSPEDEIRAELPVDSAQNQIRFNAPQFEDASFLRFTVRAESSRGQVALDELTVQVDNVINNKLPFANAGPMQRVEHTRQSVLLNGCASSDTDGKVLRYQWRESTPGFERVLPESGCEINVTLNRPDAVDVLYQFDLRVFDNQGAGSKVSRVLVTQLKNGGNSRPVVNGVSFNPDPAYLGEEIALSASAVDAEGDRIQYQWSQVSGTPVQLRDSTSSQPTFTSPSQTASLKFKMLVMDGATQAGEANGAELIVDVQQRPTFVVPGPQECLTTPTREGCLTALKFFVPSNPVTPGLGVSAVLDSAGSCTPGGDMNWPHFWGSLHEHTAYSDGAPNTKPLDVFERVKSKGLDFAINTDHSDNLGLPIPVTLADDPQFCVTSPLSCLLSDPQDPVSNLMKWDATLQQAHEVSSKSFTALRGYEWTSDRFGHANVLFSRNYVNPKTGPGYAVTMDSFWAWFLAPASLGGGDDGLLVFNHPGREDALHSLIGDPAYAFNDFAYVPSADYRVVGLEVFGKGDEYDSSGQKGSWLAYALDKGWYLAPAGSEDHHDRAWGESSLPKTVLIARTQKPEDLREAMAARRMYAVAQDFNDLRLSLTAKDSRRTYHMGARIASPDSRLLFEFKMDARPGRKAPYDLSKTVVEVITSQADNSVAYKPMMSIAGQATSFQLPVTDRQSWMFVRVRDSRSNRIVAVSAPFWFKPGSAPLPSCNPAR